MEQIKKLLIGLGAVWILVMLLPLIVLYIVLHMVYQLGEWIYNEINSSSRDW
jgi:hypothetical protein